MAGCEGTGRVFMQPRKPYPRKGFSANTEGAGTCLLPGFGHFMNVFASNKEMLSPIAPAFPGMLPAIPHFINFFASKLNTSATTLCKDALGDCISISSILRLRSCPVASSGR